MPIWRLTPTDLNHHYWKASSWKREVVVRAASEERARKIASLAFLTAERKATLGARTPGDPWGEPALVSAIAVNNADYPETGEEGIVGPKEALDYR
jgi:hypothetical protein